jgi:hypothetical protein
VVGARYRDQAVWCRLKRDATSVESACFPRVKQEYDELLSNVALNFN